MYLDRARSRRAPARSSYLYLLIASPAGAVLPAGRQAVTVWLSSEYVRAAPGGTGEAKCGGNYAASLRAQLEAAEQGCDQVVWLDALEHRWVEEMGGMNLFFVYGSGPDARIVTPELTGALLPGVTRDALLHVARTWATEPRSAGSARTSGRPATPPARSPRCSRAAPPP